MLFESVSYHALEEPKAGIREVQDENIEKPAIPSLYPAWFVVVPANLPASIDSFYQLILFE